MLSYSEYAQFFIAMLAIVDPITILPLFLHLARNTPNEKQGALADKVAAATVIVLVITVFVGESVLAFFGISFGAFRIAGGLLLLMVSLQLLNQPGTLKISDNGGSADAPSSDVVVPLAIPLLAGPGAISTVVVFTHRGAGELVHQLVLTACLLVIGLIIWSVLRMASAVKDYLSPLAIAISNKIIGLILAAISVEFIANGIKSLFLLG